MSEILIRSAIPEEVRFADREIDVLAVPYDVETLIHERGVQYLESIAPGAFGDVGARAARIRVFRDHRPERIVGKCRALDASRSSGLHATLRVAPTPLGDETLALAEEGMLDVSIGFSPRAEEWAPGRTRVRRTACWLHELSLVPLGAYDEHAGVLAVRERSLEVDPPPARTPTPYLDELREWQTRMRYGVASNQ